MTQKWEYRVSSDTDLESLASLGAEGWELVSVVHVPGGINGQTGRIELARWIYFLKRPLPAPAQAAATDHGEKPGWPVFDRSTLGSRGQDGYSTEGRGEWKYFVNHPGQGYEAVATNTGGYWARKLHQALAQAAEGEGE